MQEMGNMENSTAEQGTLKLTSTLLPTMWELDKQQEVCEI